jgi:hypothetical protein
MLALPLTHENRELVEAAVRVRADEARFDLPAIETRNAIHPLGEQSVELAQELGVGVGESDSHRPQNDAQARAWPFSVSSPAPLRQPPAGHPRASGCARRRQSSRRGGELSLAAGKRRALDREKAAHCCDAGCVLTSPLVTGPSRHHLQMDKVGRHDRVPTSRKGSTVHYHLRYYTSRLQRSHRLRYRIARLLAIWLPLMLFLYVLLVAVGTRG